MKNEEVLSNLRRLGNSRLIDLLIDSHQTEPKAARAAYQKQVNALKVKVKTLRKGIKRPSVREQLATYLDKEFPFPEKRVTQPALRCLEKTTQTDIQGKPSQSLRNQNTYLKKRIISKDTEIKRKSSQIFYLQKKNLGLTERIKRKKNKIKQVQSRCDDFKTKLQEKEEEANNLLAENEWLREMVQLDMPTKDDRGSYSVPMKECICRLLDHNVPTGQIPVVIETVLKLVGKAASDLPSKSTIKEWNVMRLCISQKQLGTEMLKTSHLGLLSDETSKFGKKFEGFHADDEEGHLYVLGLREMASKASSDVLATFQQILRDIKDRSMDSNSDVAREILLRITCTMSDRAATQEKFNELLEEYRKEILPLVMDNYDSLSDVERRSVGKLCNCFCGLHALVHLAETASSALHQAEAATFKDEAPIHDKFFRKKSEPGATRLIRTTCKAVAEGGDEKSGCHGSFLDFMRPSLRENGFNRLPIEPFRGNRFNILFQNASSVFYLSSHLQDYLDEGGATNRLLKAVQFDLKITHYLAGCKALGLVSFLITQPLWATIENTEIHIMDIGQHYKEVIDFLVMANTRIENFMVGDLHLSFCTVAVIEKDVMFNKLIQPWIHDDEVQVILQVMLPAMARLLQKMFSDHLDGGMWADVSPELRERVKGLPKHKNFSESIFGHLDRLMREKPNITTLASEAYIMFSHNKTAAWLDAKSPLEKAVIFKQARCSVKHVWKQFKSRQQEIQAARRAAVLRKLSQAEEAHQRQLEKKEKLTLDIMYWGLWQSQDQVDNYLADLDNKTTRVKALKAQLNFRQNVLQQRPANKEDNLYAFSLKKVQLTAEQLADNLKKLIEESHVLQRHQPGTGDLDTGANEPLLVGKRVKHLCSTSGDEEWYFGKVISQV